MGISFCGMINMVCDHISKNICPHLNFFPQDRQECDDTYRSVKAEAERSIEYLLANREKGVSWWLCVGGLAKCQGAVVCSCRFGLGCGAAASGDWVGIRLDLKSTSPHTHPPLSIPQTLTATWLHALYTSG